MRGFHDSYLGLATPDFFKIPALMCDIYYLCFECIDWSGVGEH